MQAKPNGRQSTREQPGHFCPTPLISLSFHDKNDMIIHHKVNHFQNNSPFYSTYVNFLGDHFEEEKKTRGKT